METQNDMHGTLVKCRGVQEGDAYYSGPWGETSDLHRADRVGELSLHDVPCVRSSNPDMARIVSNNHTLIGMHGTCGLHALLISSQSH